MTKKTQYYRAFCTANDGMLRMKLYFFLETFKKTPQQYEQNIMEYLSCYFRYIDTRLTSVYVKISHWLLAIIIMQLLANLVNIALLFSNVLYY